MCNNSKSATNNAWTSTTSASLNSCASCGCDGKKKKTETDNQWTSTTKIGNSGCGCK